MDDERLERLERELNETPQTSQQVRRLLGVLLQTPGSPVRGLFVIVVCCVLIGGVFLLISLAVDGSPSPAASGSSGSGVSYPSSSSGPDAAVYPTYDTELDAAIQAEYEATVRAIEAEAAAWEREKDAMDSNTYCNPYMEDNSCD